jgi:hypothetical protein
MILWPGVSLELVDINWLLYSIKDMARKTKLAELAERVSAS